MSEEIKSELMRRRSELFAKIDPLRRKLQPLESDLGVLNRECHTAGHFAVREKPFYPGDDCLSAKCEVCGSDLGWWCPKSPTHQCKYERSEYCIHCGQPEERL